MGTMPSALARRTTLSLAAVYLVFGVIEVYTHRDDTVAALLFWGISLLGGGLVVLAGVAAWAARPLVGLVLVVLGALLGFLATIWSLLVPLLMIAAVGLNIRDYAVRPTRATSAAQPPNASA